MKSFPRFLLLMLLIIASAGLGTVEGQSRKVRKAEAKAEKKKEQQKKAYLVSQKKDKKRRFEMQTPETKKRMKETKRNSKRINDQNRQPFLKKMFQRKKRK